jgi:hypothetical protein
MDPTLKIAKKAVETKLKLMRSQKDYLKWAPCEAVSSYLDNSIANGTKRYLREL